ncbi:type II toxin-antitoxin system HigA family antitoxin [Polynucleobacter sp. UK-Mo-2m-Kol15]|uniref:helix-turn-helix domain-containing protein n=1 Tax=Polynucleobacter sp. UK-Mo-2m-Kol15 TaxID=2576916 RepID=UPI001C0DAB67|nr:transcriptional regulator [Polynucleobacter sp. UK-Mo-2m-Kol15]MBU3574738.1 transcriptional regulator [Polynucleobacter sp. UK-Mo-2m-Kol15]
MNLNDLQKAWEALSKTVDLSPIHSEKQYQKMVGFADMLTDVIGGSKKHPLLDLLEIASELIRAYDLEHYDVPDVQPQALLSFLMEEHKLKQSDLPEVGNQSVVSQILSGTRQLNVRQINSLAKRFKIPAGVFFERAY